MRTLVPADPSLHDPSPSTPEYRLTSRAIFSAVPVCVLMSARSKYAHELLTLVSISNSIVPGSRSVNGSVTNAASAVARGWNA
jgi:hypothetical protein